MQFSYLFSLLSAGSLAAGWLTHPWLGPLSFAALWPALAFGITAAGYFGVGARVFFKRPDGTIPLASIVFMLPYLAGYWTVWHLLRVFKREDPFNEIAPGFLVGRRLLDDEVPEGLALVIDFTSEFIEPGKLRSHPGYRGFPTLDGANPRPAQLFEAIALATQSEGPVYIHCAEGHGRAGIMAAAVLLATGHTDDPDDAIALAKKARPGISLRRHQRAFLHRVAPDILAARNT